MRILVILGIGSAAFYWMDIMSPSVFAGAILPLVFLFCLLYILIAFMARRITGSSSGGFCGSIGAGGMDGGDCGGGGGGDC